MITDEAVDYKPYGMVWYGMVWYGMVWYGMLDYKIYDYRWDCRLKRLLREIKSMIIDEAVNYKPYSC